MVKEPRPGRVKTRLGRDIGMTTAAWWFRHQTRRLIGRLADPRWCLVLAVSPDREGMLSRVWPRPFARVAQGKGTLGDRMARLLKAQVPGPVCLIGADIPGITRGHVASGFAALGRADAVFGPAPDGGYWLIGVAHPSRLPPTLFTEVRWSTEHALADTRATMRDLRVALVEPLQDVDTVDDLAMTRAGARDT